jgi:hypothetical protein
MYYFIILYNLDDYNTNMKIAFVGKPEGKRAFERLGQGKPVR